MPRNSFTMTVDDTTALEASLVALPEALKPYIKAAAGISAANIREEAQTRLLRQLSGHSTGETVQGILVNPDRSGWGWVVDAGNLTTPMLDHWLELGTKFMHARPFFADAARLEEQAHRERVGAAIQQCLVDHGLGDV